MGSMMILRYQLHCFMMFMKIVMKNYLLTAKGTYMSIPFGRRVLEIIRLFNQGVRIDDYELGKYFPNG